MIRSYLNEDVTRHPFASVSEWGAITWGTDETIKARVNHRNIVVTNVQGEEKVSRSQLTVVFGQAVDARDEFTVDGERMNVVEIKPKMQDFVGRAKEVKLA